MNYRRNLKTGESISILGYGCMRFPTKMGQIDVDPAVEMVKCAILNGVNYLDTAYPYHGFKSESFLGDHILNQDFAKGVKVATKMPVYLVKKRDDLYKFFNKQYAKLKVERIDYYLLHALNRSSYEEMQQLGIHEFLDEIKQEGKIKNIGFSFHGKLDGFKYIIDSYDWDFCQIQLNIVDENFQAGLAGLNYAYEKGVSIIIMEPLRGGSLVNNLPLSAQKLYESYPKQYNNVEWALKYLFNNPKVMCVLSGMSTLEQVQENVKIASQSDVGCLDNDDIALLQAVKKTYESELEVSCTACGYCVDCPVQINIPYAFQTLNTYKLFKSRGEKALYAKTVGYNSDVARWTTTCIDCGKCELHCPQDIEIRKEFKKVQRYVETKPLRYTTSILRMMMGKNK